MSLRRNEMVHLHKKAHRLCEASKEWFDEITIELNNAGWIASDAGTMPCG